MYIVYSSNFNWVENIYFIKFSTIKINTILNEACPFKIIKKNEFVD
jgi:hypothetical protein